MILLEMVYTVKQLADKAGVSVRTLHYYDQLGLLKPGRRNPGGYRYYSQEAVVCLQQIMFFRELGFALQEIGEIMSRPDFDVLEALESHRKLLEEKAGRIRRLQLTVKKTIRELKGGSAMSIKEYYQGFSDEKIERYRREVKERWGEKTLEESEARVLRMGKEKFAELQAEGGRIFQAMCDNMAGGCQSEEVQSQVALWRQWLENFHYYSDEAVLGLARAYSQHPEFAAFFRKYHPELPEFFTRAVEYYFECRKP
jgi:DNA-binding transcriptional MerR regulator